MRRLAPIALLACTLISSVAWADDEDPAPPAPLTPADVVAVMTGRRGAIRKKCYEDRTDKVDTAMKIDFSITPNGLVADALAHETSGSTEIIDCVIAEVRRTVFRSSSEGGRFRWPFIFKGP